MQAAAGLDRCSEFVKAGFACLRVESDGEGYVLEAVLGRGSFAEVVLARRYLDGAPPTAVAVKCYSRSRLLRQRSTPHRWRRGGGSVAKGAHSSAPATALDKVSREIGLLRELGSHPCIVGMHRALVDEEGDAIYVVLDFVDGGEIMTVVPDAPAADGGPRREVAAARSSSPTFCDAPAEVEAAFSDSAAAAGADEDARRPQRTFASRLTGGPLPLAAARAAIADLLSALAHAHSLHIAHRDVKPENALVGSVDGVLRLADWGAAQRFDAPPVVVPAPASQVPVNASATARPLGWVSDTVGTLLFLPPEAVHGGPHAAAPAEGVVSGAGTALRGENDGDGDDTVLPPLAHAATPVTVVDARGVSQPESRPSDYRADCRADNLDKGVSPPTASVSVGGYDAFAADVWAAGLTAHIFLFGVLPFGIGGATNLLSAMAAIGEGDGGPPLLPLPLHRAHDAAELLPVLQPLQQLLGALLERSPAARVTAAAALALPFLSSGVGVDARSRARYPPLDLQALPRYTTPAVAMDLSTVTPLAATDLRGRAGGGAMQLDEAGSGGAPEPSPAAPAATYAAFIDEPRIGAAVAPLRRHGRGVSWVSRLGATLSRLWTPPTLPPPAHGL